MIAVIVAPQTQKVGLVACERATGKIRWRSAYIGRNWYSHVSTCLARFGGIEQIMTAPASPYAQALLKCFEASSGGGLPYIPGRVPDLHEVLLGCPFAPRCPVVQPVCQAERPLLHEVAAPNQAGHAVADDQAAGHAVATHYVACHFA